MGKVVVTWGGGSVVAKTFFFLSICAMPLLAAPQGSKTADGQAATRHDAGVPIDPVYKDIALKTGGQAVDMRDAAQARAFQKSLNVTRRRAWVQRWRDRLSLSDGARIVLYICLKWIVYSLWCAVALFWNGAKPAFWRAMGWGILRVIVGIGFGITIGFLFLLASKWVNVMRAGYPFVYLILYVPTRWVEWTLMGNLLKIKEQRTIWRLGGIAVSCMADGAQMLMLGSLIPIGRIFC